MFGMDKSRLRLMPHDTAWSDDFAAESERIMAAGGDCFLRIEHVGSTAIPNVYAKPILDLAILCAPEQLEKLAEGLRKIGYEFRGRFDETEAGHYYAVRDENNVRFCQAHIYTAANDDWDLKLKFRDVLRQNAELAREYSEYKLSLAQRVSDKKEYAKIKDKWVDSFILKIL